MYRLSINKDSELGPEWTEKLRRQREQKMGEKDL